MIYILAFSQQRLFHSCLSNRIVAGFILYLQQLVSIPYHNQWSLKGSTTTNYSLHSQMIVLF